ncbi:Efflux pump dotC [Colletotrichum sp. SAR 10_70]|nr:Efflux pump dotC [Colletotrichum sp. SAR 10_71]KAI8171499.1 Efflux pump dotC [Colletotrichum sp. SAR 10_70]KAI8176913.1 Efflux pump dotC [Colletotrichum sp. SAR 10_75]KAI8209676.1 Efflux pump dotC [Colletotrichum sp. SAR 10_76]KAI8233487.1 Efflux pump dotC [Colletotrichum sp. SAR 10_77]KAJ5000312.1 Efflux pump dotC [Colletotrichum sp. SAR 10_66]
MNEKPDPADSSPREAGGIITNTPESSQTPETVMESPTSTDKKSEAHTFNEQTNYVSKVKVITGAVTALANGIGPVIGGTLSSKGGDSWRWIFRLNLPLTALSAVCALFFMPLRKVTGDWKVKTRAIDFVGILLALAGTTSLMLGLTWGGGEYPWASAAVLTTLLVGFFICVVFVLWQWKGPRYPLVPLDIFRARMTIGACITMAINGWNFVVQVYYIPTFYQLVYNYGATRSGVMLLPITLVQTASSTLSGLIVHRVGRYRECILFGWLCWSVGLGLMSTLDETSGLGKQIGYSLLIGVGVGNTLQPALVAIQAGVPRKDMAVVTSFRKNNIVKSSVNDLDLGVEQRDSLLSNPQQYISSLSDEDAQRIRAVLAPAYQKSFKVIFELGSGLAAGAFFVAWFLMPHIDLSRPDDHKLKEEGHQAQLKENADAAEKSP